MFSDNYDLELSSSSSAACAAFRAGMDSALRLDHPGITELRQSIDLDADFALAHAALGRQLQIHGFRTEVAEHLDRAIELSSVVTKREQSAIEVIVAAATFRENAMAMATTHIDHHPHDVFVLSHLVGPFGLLAFSGQHEWREKNVALLEALSTHYSADDWWYLSTQSFMAAETGDMVAARKYGQQAWRLSENGNCAHSLAHVHFEEGAVDEGVEFLSDWAETSGVDSDMRHHLLWHLALLLREKGADASVLLSIYERELDPRINDPMPLSTFSDNAAVLWRCKLSGLDIPAEICRDLANYADKHYPDRGFAFADIHRVMSTALLNDEEKQRALIDELLQIASEGESQLANAMVQYAKGFCAFANRDFRQSVDCLKPVLDGSVLLGGSNPQRRIVAETYRAALSARV